jgi:peroxiredoxin Q/BCP
LLQQHHFNVIGISPDEVAQHKHFETKFDLPFTLIADPQHSIINTFGVWGKKLLYGREYMGLHRTTFVINEKGIIVKIFLKPTNKKHAQQIIEAYTKLTLQK